MATKKDAETARESRRVTVATPAPKAPTPKAPTPKTTGVEKQLKGLDKSLKELGRIAGTLAGGGAAETAAVDSNQALIDALNAQAAANAAAQAEAARLAAEASAAQAKAERQSAYDLLFQEFSTFGLGGLVEPLRALITEGVSPAEFTIRLRNTDAYKKRFAANATRIGKGLRALSEAEYIGLEDQYQNIMRQYGLPASYYTRGDMGRQEGFEKFIGGDVSAAELEDRIQTAQNRVINAAPEIASSLRSFYPDITNGDILAYALDPDKAITEIRRKVTAAEIQGAATMAGLNVIKPGTTPEQIAALRGRAEELGRFGVTGEAARQGFRAVAEIAPRGGQLAEFYRQTPYTQATAEQEVFGLTGAAEAGRQRRKLTELETAAFSGQAGAAGGALARDRAGAF